MVIGTNNNLLLQIKLVLLTQLLLLSEAGKHAAKQVQLALCFSLMSE